MPTPRLFLSVLSDRDALEALEFGRVADGQPADHWRMLTENVGVLLDAPDGHEVGFRVMHASAIEDEDHEEIWNGPRFHVPVLALEDASIGEIVLAAHGQYRSQVSLNRACFTSAVSARGTEALRYWRACLDAGDGMGHFGVGYTLYDLGHFHEAYKHLRYYAHLSPMDAWNWSWLAKAALAIGETEEARSACLRALELEDEDEPTDASELLAEIGG